MSTQPKKRSAVTMPILSDDAVFLTGCTGIPLANGEDPVRIRFDREPGYIQARVFTWIMRFLLSSSGTKDQDPRARRIGPDEYEFTPRPLTVRAKVFPGGRVTMRVIVHVAQEGHTAWRELDSITCKELGERIEHMRESLEKYDNEGDILGIPIDEDDWFNSLKSDDIDQRISANETKAVA